MSIHMPTTKEIEEYEREERERLCDHLEFRAKVKVSRIEDCAVWYADLAVECLACGQEMQFVGFPQGLSPGEPMTNVDGTELRIPFRPYSEEEARRRFLNEEQAGFRISRRDA